MIKKWLAVTGIALLILLLAPGTALADTNILINGEPVQSTAEVLDGSFFLPLRAVCEALGFKVQWSEKEKLITVSRGDRNVVFNLTASAMEVDGHEMKLEGKYRIVAGRAYLYEGFFSDILGVQVKWDKENRTVTLLPDAIPLKFVPVENNQSVKTEKKLQIGSMTDRTEVDSGIAYIYEKADDKENLHGGFAGKAGFYDLGTVGSIMNSSNDLTCVKVFELYGKTVIKLQGIFGSHVASTNYFVMDDGIPKPFLSVDGPTTEMDINGDGKKEIVAELSGTIPSAAIYKWEEGSLSVASVDQALGAEAVIFNHEDGSFHAYYKTNGPENPDGITFQYTHSGLELKKAAKDVGEILSENVIDYNRDSSYEKVIIKMVNDRQYEEVLPGPFTGWNWQGKFVVQITDANGKVISELGLNKIFDPNGEDLIFNRTFLLQFDDYNNDGSPDFAIDRPVWLKQWKPVQIVYD